VGKHVKGKEVLRVTLSKVL